ncbi:hypothetical protein D3C72_571150 [compost metagenome]
MVIRVLAVSEVGLEQRLLQLTLTSLCGGPEQQSMGVEGVVEMAAFFQVEVKTDLLAAFDDHRVTVRHLLGAAPVFAHHVLDGVLTFGGHVGVQFERFVGQLHVDFACQVADRLLQSGGAQRAPGANDIRDEIDFHGPAHDCESANCWRYSVVVMPA